MPTVMSMRWNGVTPEQYEEARKSPEHFQRFVESRLMPGVRQIGIEGEPKVELHDAHAVLAPAYERAGA